MIWWADTLSGGGLKYILIPLLLLLVFFYKSIVAEQDCYANCLFFDFTQTLQSSF